MNSPFINKSSNLPDQNSNTSNLLDNIHTFNTYNSYNPTTNEKIVIENNELKNQITQMNFSQANATGTTKQSNSGSPPSILQNSIHRSQNEEMNSSNSIRVKRTPYKELTVQIPNSSSPLEIKSSPQVPISSDTINYPLTHNSSINSFLQDHHSFASEYDIEFDHLSARGFFFGLSQGEQTMKIKDLENILLERKEFETELEKEAVYSFIDYLFELKRSSSKNLENEENLKQENSNYSKLPIPMSIQKLPFWDKLMSQFNHSEGEKEEFSSSNEYYSKFQLNDIPKNLFHLIKDEDGDDLIHINEFEFLLTQKSMIRHSHDDLLDAFQTFDVSNLEEIPLELLIDIYSDWGNYSIGQDALDLFNHFSISNIDTDSNPSIDQKYINYRSLVSSLVPNHKDLIITNLPNWKWLEKLIQSNQ